MGCVYCNITATKSFRRDGIDLPNPFYCETPEEALAFIRELCNDMRQNHPDIWLQVSRSALTPVESKIVELIYAGKDPRLAGSKGPLQVGSVKVYLAKIKKKTGWVPPGAKEILL